MAELEIAPLLLRLEDDTLAQLRGALSAQGVSRLPREAGTATTLGNRIDEDALQEFLDLLAGHDAACDIYLPLDASLGGPLDAPVQVGDLRVGSTDHLLSALEELRGDLDIDEDGDEDPDEESDDIEGKMRGIWRLFQQGAEAAQLRRLPLHVHP